MTTDGHWTLCPASCPVCGGHEAKFLGYRGGWAHRSGRGVAVPIVRCRSCATSYPNPTPYPRDHSHYDGAADYFAPAEDEATIAAFASTLRRIAELRGGPGRVLDVGCGLGQALVAAERSGWDAVGLEPSSTFAEEGRRRFGVDIQEQTLVPGLLEHASFDAVLFSGVLEHVYNPVQLLAIAREVLLPGGVVYVDVPNESSWFQAVGRFALRTRRRDWCVALSPTFAPFHVVGFCPRALRTAFDRAGLEVLAIDSYPLSFASAGLPGPVRSVTNWIEHRAVSVGRSAGLVGWARAPEFER